MPSSAYGIVHASPQWELMSRSKRSLWQASPSSVPMMHPEIA